MSKFRWAYIGSGAIARKTAAQITKTGGHEIVSVYSRTQKNAQSFAAKFGCMPCATFEQAVCRDDIDCVYVCTTNNLHFAHAMAAIEAGKPVLVEKPFALSAAEAEQLFAAAQNRGVYIAEGMWTWFNPVARGVKDWLDSGKLGRANRAEFALELNILFFKSKRERLLSPELGGGALLDLGVYPLTYAYRLFGAPKKIDFAKEMQNGVDVGEKITAHYDGFDAAMRIAVNKNSREKAIINCEYGSIIIPGFHCAKQATLKMLDGKIEHAVGGGSYVAEFDGVAEEIRGGKLTSSFAPKEATIAVLSTITELLSREPQ